MSVTHAHAVARCWPGLTSNALRGSAPAPLPADLAPARPSPRPPGLPLRFPCNGQVEACRDRDRDDGGDDGGDDGDDGSPPVPARPRRGDIRTCMVDWNLPLPEAVEQFPADVIIVSDEGSEWVGGWVMSPWVVRERGRYTLACCWAHPRFCCLFRVYGTTRAGGSACFGCCRSLARRCCFTS